MPSFLNFVHLLCCLRELHYAMNNLTVIDENQAKAVEVRQELDLRSGVVFTRFLTVNFKNQVESAMKDKIISYGPCQFPTLGFVVDQYLKVKNFIPEDFWTISLGISKGVFTIPFSWARGRLFDPMATFLFYERMIADSQPLMTSVKTTQTSQRKPYPLTTIALQKFVSSFFKISSHDLMKIAESLYNRGYISYPRTETDQYPSSFDFETLIRQQTGNPSWGDFARKLMEVPGEFELPRRGKNNDQAHPPIHPTKPGLDLAGTEARVYEFITRRFLACCSKDAIGLSTNLVLKLAGELFTASGSRPLQKNYMDVYIYDKWSSNELPEFTEGERLSIAELLMNSGQTSPPKLLSESDLITTMDKNGIGTDATIHDHIQTIITRGYVVRRSGDRRFEPRPLGIALIVGFDAIPFSLPISLSRPELRKNMELDLKLIAEARKSDQQVLQEMIRLYQLVYETVKQNQHILRDSFSTIINSSCSTGLDNCQRTTIALDSDCEDNGNFDDDDDKGDENSRGQARETRRGTGSKRGASNQKRYKSSSSHSRTFTSSSISNNFINGNTSSGARRSGQVGEYKCDCGLDAKVAITKSGENAGREYATCVKTARRCKYFLWIDGEPNGKLKSMMTRRAQY